jgi:hypothetical protein
MYLSFHRSSTAQLVSRHAWVMWSASGGCHDLGQTTDGPAEVNDGTCLGGWRSLFRTCEWCLGLVDKKSLGVPSCP